MDYTPYWATTSGGHYWQVAFNENGSPIPFFMGDDTPAEFFMRREPSKVLRITYSKQKNIPTEYALEDQIPDGFLRRSNFIDVTDQYWKTSSLEVKFFPNCPTDNIAYLSVLNGSKWRICWWAQMKQGKADFEKMSCGVVYLPMIYQDRKEIPAADPYLLTPNGNIQVLKPNKERTQTVTIEQKTNYLLFRPNTKYNLCYWDSSTAKWISIEIKTSGGNVNLGTVLQFENAPTNALFVLIPEYSKGKERPFTIDDIGRMNWW